MKGKSKLKILASILAIVILINVGFEKELYCMANEIVETSKADINLEETTDNVDKTKELETEIETEIQKETETETEKATEVEKETETETTIKDNELKKEIGNILKYENNNVKIEVASTEAYKIPNNYTLKVTPIIENNKNTGKKYQEVKKQLDENITEDKDTDIVGFLAYDIKLLDENGNEKEPDGKVNVSIVYNNPTIAEHENEEEFNNADVTVMHFKENEKGLVKEIIDLKKAGQINNIDTSKNQEVKSVKFETDSFSIYTVTWTNNVNKSTLRLHYIIKDGYNISRALSNYKEIKINSSNWIEINNYQRNFKGYEFAGTFRNQEGTGDNIYRVRPVELNNSNIWKYSNSPNQTFNKDVSDHLTQSGICTVNQKIFDVYYIYEKTDTKQISGNYIDLYLSGNKDNTSGIKVSIVNEDGEKFTGTSNVYGIVTEIYDSSNKIVSRLPWGVYTIKADVTKDNKLYSGVKSITITETSGFLQGKVYITTTGDFKGLHMDVKRDSATTMGTPEAVINLACYRNGNKYYINSKKDKTRGTIIETNQEYLLNRGTIEKLPNQSNSSARQYYTSWTLKYTNPNGEGQLAYKYNEENGLEYNFTGFTESQKYYYDMNTVIEFAATFDNGATIDVCLDKNSVFPDNTYYPTDGDCAEKLHIFGCKSIYGDDGYLIGYDISGMSVFQVSRIICNQSTVTKGNVTNGGMDLVINYATLLKNATNHITGTKKLLSNNNRKLKDNEFNFELNELTGNWLNTINYKQNTKRASSNKANGSFDFGEFDYDTEGIHYYIIKEVVPESPKQDITYDNTIYGVKHEVTKTTTTVNGTTQVTKLSVKQTVCKLKKYGNKYIEITKLNENAQIAYNNQVKTNSDLIIEKKWKDSENKDKIRPESIWIMITRKDSSKENEEEYLKVKLDVNSNDAKFNLISDISTDIVKKLMADNSYSNIQIKNTSWKCEIKGLESGYYTEGDDPKWVKYTYNVKEIKVINDPNIEKKYYEQFGYKDNTITGENGQFTITNSLTYQPVAVKKVWNDGYDKHINDYVNVKLHALYVDGNTTKEIPEDYLKNFTNGEIVQKLNKENNWKYTWNDLPVYYYSEADSKTYQITKFEFEETEMSISSTIYTKGDDGLFKNNKGSICPYIPTIDNVDKIEAVDKEFVATVTNSINYNINLIKKDEQKVNNADKFLKGAQFKLMIKNSKGDLVDYESDAFKKDTVVTTDVSGKASFKNIPSGTYYIVETKAPMDYVLNSEPKEVVVGESNSNKNVEVVITNNRINKLPSTGGIGTKFYIYTGIMLVIFAIFISIKKDKYFLKNNKKIVDIENEKC